MKRRLMIGYLASAFVAAGVLGYWGCGGSSPGNPQDCTTCTLPSLAGSWSGTWMDTRYNVSGAITAVLQQNGTNFTATGTIDLTALGLGPWNGTAMGTISGNTVTFTFTSASVGTALRAPLQAKMCFRAASQIAATAGCLSLCSTEMA